MLTKEQAFETLVNAGLRAERAYKVVSAAAQFPWSRYYPENLPMWIRFNPRDAGVRYGYEIEINGSLVEISEDPAVKILREFVTDVEAAYKDCDGKVRTDDWPDLFATYQKARAFLDTIS